MRRIGIDSMLVMRLMGAVREEPLGNSSTSILSTTK